MKSAMLLICFLLFGISSFSYASSRYYLKGTVRDVAGEPVALAEVYLYSTPNVRRAADFISSKSDSLGRYMLEIPAATYWAVARVRNGERFGPLEMGYRHSGEPVQVIINDDPETVLDFTVANLKEVALNKTKSASKLVTLRGRILDRDGVAHPNTYAFAFINKHSDTIPEYISPWVDKEGHYILQLLPGDYVIGCSIEFPPVYDIKDFKRIHIDIENLPNTETDLLLNKR